MVEEVVEELVEGWWSRWRPFLERRGCFERQVPRKREREVAGERKEVVSRELI